MLIKDLIERLQKFKPTDSALLVYSTHYPDDVQDILYDAAAGPGETNVIITNVP